MQAFIFRGTITITSIVEGFSVVRSSNTKKFFGNYFFSLFINKESFGRKVSKENSLCLVLQQERFSEKSQYYFSHFFVTFCQFLTFLRQYNPCKELLVIRLEMICRTQIYFTSKNALNP